MDDRGTQHPTSEELLRLTIQDLPRGRAVEVQEHLISCGSCLAEARGFLHLPDTPSWLDEQIGDAELRLAWSKLLMAIARGAPLSQMLILPGMTSAASRRKPSSLALRKRPSSFLAVAAALLIGTGIGFLGKSATFQAEITAARASAGLTFLVPKDFQVRGPRLEPPQVVCPPSYGTFVWVLSSSEQPVSETATTVLIKGSDGTSMSLEGVPIDARGEVVLGLPWSQIPDGTYEIQIGAGKNGPRENFTVLVECQ